MFGCLGGLGRHYRCSAEAESVVCAPRSPALLPTVDMAWVAFVIVCSPQVGRRAQRRVRPHRLHHQGTPAAGACTSDRGLSLPAWALRRSRPPQVEPQNALPSSRPNSTPCPSARTPRTVNSYLMSTCVCVTMALHCAVKVPWPSQALKSPPAPPAGVPPEHRGGGPRAGHRHDQAQGALPHAGHPAMAVAQAQVHGQADREPKRAGGPGAKRQGRESSRPAHTRVALCTKQRRMYAIITMLHSDQGL